MLRYKVDSFRALSFVHRIFKFGPNYSSSNSKLCSESIFVSEGKGNIKLNSESITQVINSILQSFEHELSKIHVGRPSPKFLENITICKKNSSKTVVNLGKLVNVGYVIVQDSNTVQIRAKQNSAANIDDILCSIEAHTSDMATCFKHQNDSIVLSFPKPNKESREALSKVISQNHEAYRLKIRGTRNSLISFVKAEKSISEDFRRQFELSIQQKHDNAMHSLKTLADKKRNEILTA